MKERNRQQGFTLMEIIIALTIVAIVATVGFISYTSTIVKVRDARRKEDLRQIVTALQTYYTQNGQYPPAGPCAYGDSCHVYSSAGDAWIPDLVPTYLVRLPIDPSDGCDGPWIPDCLTYSYGNVSADGQSFDLLTQLENPNDEARCGIKNYHEGGIATNPSWCTAFGGTGSDQLYQQPVP